jgi:hypothetical protein
MKNIIDFYECGINATPANTMGMGNPCAPTDTTVGSEPLIPTCKRGKCKKEKAKKSEKIEEASILGDVEDTIQAGDDVVEFAQWFLEATIEGYSLTEIGSKFKIDYDDYLPKLASCVVSPSKGVFVLDTFKMFDAECSKLCDRIYLTEKALKNMPKGLKTIKIYNCKYGEYQMSCYTHDVSKLNIEVYADEGRSYGNLKAVFWNKIKNKNVKFGKLTCSNFKVGTYASKIESIMLAKDSTMITVDLSENENLTDIYGRFEHAMTVKFPRQLVARQLASAGIIPHGCELKIYN